MKDILEWFDGDELAAHVWWDKYALKESGVVVEKTPEDTIDRLTNEFHRVEQKYINPMPREEIYDLLSGFKKVIPAGSPLFGIGNTKAITSLSNCYVVESPIDSYGGILKTDEELVQLMKRRGGVGVDISTIRPSGARVSNSAGTSTGILPFMDRYSNTTKEVAQEGRRGALILTINVDHPDIEKFITSKNDLSKINGANISIKITDEFMRAVTDPVMSAYELHHPYQRGEEPIIVDAKAIWNKLIHQAWKTAEPGVLFWDRIIEESPADCYKHFKTISTNPCGELPLCAYDSCRLLHVNVYEFVRNPFTNKAYFDIDAYKDTVFKAQRLMDDMIDLEEEKLDQIIRKIEKDPESAGIKFRELQLWMAIKSKLIHGRRTGLNPLLGLADAFAALGLKYDSDEAIAVAEMMAATAAKESYKSSINLAQERGSFKDWIYDAEKDNPFLNRVLDALFDESPEYVDLYREFGRRNIANLTIPPSGSIAILAQVASGIEPVFNLSYNRKRKVSSDHDRKSFLDKDGQWWEEYTVYHPKYKDWLNTGGMGKSPYDGSTTNEIDPLQKVRLQGAIQRWIDHSISITHNVPENITEAEVSNIYMEAWKSGCKGCTIYREGSREGILTNKKKIIFEQHDAPKRPKVVLHDIHNVVSKGIKWTICVGLLEGKPYEVFAVDQLNINGKYSGEIIKQTRGRYDLAIKDVGYFENITEHCSDEENLLTRMISTSLRHGADIKFVAEQLDKSEGDITSFGKGIARVLKKYIKDYTTKDNCPECNHNLVFEGGCSVCPNCGYSKCS